MAPASHYSNFVKIPQPAQMLFTQASNTDLIMLKLSLNKIRKQGYELHHTFNNMLKFSANLTKEEGFIPNRMLARILQLGPFKSLRLNEFNCRHETNFTNSVYIKPVFCTTAIY